MPPNPYLSTYQGDFGSKYGRNLSKYSAMNQPSSSMYPEPNRSMGTQSFISPVPPFGFNKYSVQDWSLSNTAQFNRSVRWWKHKVEGPILYLPIPMAPISVFFDISESRSLSYRHQGVFLQRFGNLKNILVPL